jgi:hypothetical protein
MSERPKTLQELLAKMEIAREHGAEYDWAPVLRNILYGTDTAPGLVERVAKATGADLSGMTTQNGLDYAYQAALTSEIGPATSSDGADQ